MIVQLLLDGFHYSFVHCRPSFACANFTSTASVSPGEMLDHVSGVAN
ncbi:hypothetical protein IMCC21224_11790 [Puniceibacterium sp. IMCC21224]|nr:hypothetical protein IMCC21224_11790 [Puniceibacterium sp. IMCC21224]